MDRIKDSGSFDYGSTPYGFTLSKEAIGHISMAIASMMWGLMAPLGKDAMTHGISGFNMVGIRVMGGALCFWMASLIASRFSKRTDSNSASSNVDAQNKAPLTRHELIRLFGAAMFAIIFNQCNYIVGLSITSPLNASIMTTTMPILTLILSALILKEKLTIRRVTGVLLGAMGALTLILASAGGTAEGGVLLGDMMCVAGQLSYAFYLTKFKDVISRHSAIDCQKWMMLFAAITLSPITIPGLMQVNWAEITTKTYLETTFVVVGGTFLSFLFSTRAQKILRPTVIAMYNYVQPLVACTVSVLLGLGIFGWSHLVAVILVFMGVRLVNKKK